MQIGASETNGLTAVLSINNDRSWTKIEITYLVHARDDLWVGNFVANNFQWMGCDRNNGQLKNAVVQAGIAGFRTNTNIRSAALSFISGIRT